jgi:HEAT repeat protein
MMALDEERARKLAQDDPRMLIAILKDATREPHELYFAAESAAYTQEPDVVEALLPLLSHHNAVVREGAARGLSESASDPAARVRLQEVRVRDPVEAVRIAADDALMR